MSISLETLAASKTFTVATVEGAGAIKGKNCTIASIADITGGHRVTFKWYLDNGTEQTGTMDVMDGVNGKDGKDGKDGSVVAIDPVLETGTKIAVVTIDGVDFDLYAPAGGGGTSDYSDLTNKPSINSVTLSGNKTTSDLGISYNDLSNKPTIPSTDNCYQTTDTVGTSLNNDDTMPYYNASVSSKRKITWSNIKTTLKTYFDGLYLTDVNISSPTNGQVIKYDALSSKWINAAESGGGGGSSTNYSTVEQQIGTWLDGTTAVYQKVEALETITLATTLSINVESWNIDKLISVWGFGNLYHDNVYQGHVVFPSTGTGTYNQNIYIKGNTSDTSIAIYSSKASGSSTQTVKDGYLVVQYTKKATS